MSSGEGEKTEVTTSEPVQPFQQAVVTSAVTNQPTNAEDVLRSAFVEMMFALAVAEVATHAADLVRITAPFRDKVPAVFHLLLALIVIAASWVGWRRSESPGMKVHIESVFSFPFIGLLIDVALVTIYFILARQVEITAGDQPALTPPSAKPEALWVVVMFGAYAVWDLVADVFSPGCMPPGDVLWARLLRTPLVAFVSVFSSAACLGLAAIAMYIAQGLADVRRAVAIDVALIAVVLLFRAIKVIENPLSKWLGVDDCQAFKKRREVKVGELIAAAILVAAFGAALMTARPVRG